MRLILKILIFFMAINCKAQTPVFDIEDVANISHDIYGAYHKDTTNQLNAYEGTFLYSNGSNELKIVLQKKLMSSMNGYYYEDLIIGEYRYLENGIEKVNTLDKLDIAYANQVNHSIDGNTILTGTIFGCDDCTATEKRLRLGMVDPVSNSIANLDVRRIIVNGQPAIHIVITYTNASTMGSPASVNIPGGDYMLIKQP